VLEREIAERIGVVAFRRLHGSACREEPSTASGADIGGRDLRLTLSSGDDYRAMDPRPTFTVAVVPSSQVT
jgi:hypothetical protein